MGIEEDIKNFKRFEKYVKKSQPSLALNFGEMVVLSGEDFANHYLALMETFKVTEKWWSIGNIPLCYNCNEEIFSSKQLRMYKSNSYHANCFRRVYEINEESELMKRYWERVLVLEF